MATWPSALPPIRIPVSIERQDNTIRTNMESGPQKVRKRFTATSTFFAFPIRMTGAQYETLMNFYESNTAIPFDMAHPTTGDTESFRFQGPPSASIATGEANPDKRTVDVNIQLEKLP